VLQGEEKANFVCPRADVKAGCEERKRSAELLHAKRKKGVVCGGLLEMIFLFPGKFLVLAVLQHS
jgi:hypothetical protein